MKSIHASLCLLVAMAFGVTVHANVCDVCNRVFSPKNGENGRLCPKCVEERARIQNAPSAVELLLFGKEGAEKLRKEREKAARNRYSPEEQLVLTLFGVRGENDEAQEAMPTVVEVRFGEWDKLKKGEQPLWGDYIVAYYPTLSRKEATGIAMQVNEARAGISPRGLAEAAVALGRHAPKKDVPRYFLADTLFREAIRLSILCGKVGNKPMLIQLWKMYKDAPFKNADVLEELEAEIKAGPAAKK